MQVSNARASGTGKAESRIKAKMTPESARLPAKVQLPGRDPFVAVKFLSRKRRLRCGCVSHNCRSRSGSIALMRCAGGSLILPGRTGRSPSNAKAAFGRRGGIRRQFSRRREVRAMPYFWSKNRKLGMLGSHKHHLLSMRHGLNVPAQAERLADFHDCRKLRTAFSRKRFVKTFSRQPRVFSHL